MIEQRPERESQPLERIFELLERQHRDPRDQAAFGRIAVERGWISPEQLDRALAEQARSGRLLGRILLDGGALTEQRVDEILSEQRRRKEAPPELIADRYEIRELIGQGAMARVYRATDRQLKRSVAVKILNPDPGFQEVLRERFRREALAVARLSHPNIVTIHDAGEQDGRLYLVMELLPGQPLSDLLDRRALDVRSALALMEKVARGVHHANEHGVVHRDLKPANIVVTGAGDPKVADFGLAHLIGAQATLTADGSGLGTPMYMAPEQVGARPGAITPRTDVYAMGAILYEALTGRPAHTGETLAQIFSRILYDEPVPPRARNRRVPPDVEAVCLKALEKRAERRYATAAAFADDLRRHLAGEPVTAKPLGSLARAWRKAVRHRAVLLPAAAVLLAMLALGAWAARSVGRTSAKLRQTLATADRHESDGRLEEARDAFRSALALDERNERARRGLERADAEIRRRTAEALELFENGRPALDKAFAYLYDANADYTELVKRVDAGQTSIEQGIALAPHLAVGHHLLGRAWHIKGWDDRAEACWRKAIACDPGFSPAHLELGRLLLAKSYIAGLGKSREERTARRSQAEQIAQEAADQINAATASGIGDPLQQLIAAVMLNRDTERGREMARAGLAQFAEREGREELHWLLGTMVANDREAIAAYGQAIAIRPKFALALFSRAARRAQLGDDAGAVEDYASVVQISPRFAAAWTNRGRSRVRLGDPDGAIADHTEALRINPSYAMAYYNRGIAHSRKNDLEAALADHTQAIRIDPDYAGAWCERGTVRHQRGDSEGALGDLDEALRLSPRLTIALYNRGVVRAALENPDGALADYTEVIRIDPRYAKAYVERAALKQARGDLQGALADCNEALRRDSRLASAYVRRATVRYDSHEYDFAIADCDAALAIDPRSALAYARRAQARIGKGDFDGAIADCDEAIRIETRHAMAHAFRGLARRGKGDPDGAIADLDRAVEFDAKYAYAYYMRALARLDKKDSAMAIRDLEKALEVARPSWGLRRKAEELLEKTAKQ